MKSESLRGYVYIVYWSYQGPIKIGWSTAPKARLAALQGQMPYKISFYGVVRVSHPTALESHMHRLFTQDRLRGEWFSTKPSQAWVTLKRAAADHDSRWTIWKPAPVRAPSDSLRLIAAIDEYNYLKSLE